MFQITVKSQPLSKLCAKPSQKAVVNLYKDVAHVILFSVYRDYT